MCRKQWQTLDVRNPRIAIRDPNAAVREPCLDMLLDLRLGPTGPPAAASPPDSPARIGHGPAG
jgi:hypothetical protein